jgi:hypothetical protein
VLGAAAPRCRLLSTQLNMPPRPPALVAAVEAGPAPAGEPCCWCWCCEGVATCGNMEGLAAAPRGGLLLAAAPNAALPGA